MSSLKERINNSLKNKNKKLSKSQLKAISQFQIDDRYTQTIVISDQVEFRFEKVRTINASDNSVYDGVNIRQYISRKPGGKRDKPSKGLIVPDANWHEFLQGAVEFHKAVYGKESVEYDDEEEDETEPASAPFPLVKKQPSPDELRKMSVARKSAEEVNWADVEKIGKSRRR